MRGQRARVSVRAHRPDLVRLARWTSPLQSTKPDSFGRPFLSALGGLAINRLGYVRATDDIDLLIAHDLANRQRVKQALETLPDKAVRDLGEDDLAQWLVVRVNDEITVDLMTEACGVSFDGASHGIETVEIDGVPIPFASAALMLKMKQGAREKDGLDRKFLERLVAEKKRAENS